MHPLPHPLTPSLSDVPRFHLIYRIINLVINKNQKEELSHKLD